MFKKYVKLEKSMRIYYAKKNENFLLSKEDSDVIKEIIEILKPVEYAIKEIGTDDSNLMVADIAEIECLKRIGTSSLLRAEFHRQIKKRFEERRTLYSDVLWDINNMSDVYGDNVFFQSQAMILSLNYKRSLDMMCVSRILLIHMSMQKIQKCQKLVTSIMT